VSASGKKTAVLTAAALVAGIVISAAAVGGAFDPLVGLNAPEAIGGLDLGQEAARLASGRGFTTGFIRPVSLRFNDSFTAHPDFANPPLYVLVLAAAMAVFGRSDALLAGTSAVFLWLWAFPLWCTVSRIFGKREAALALFLYLVSPALLDEAAAASPAPFLAGLVMGAVVLTEWSRARRPVSALVPGICVGLGYLGHYTFGLWLLPAAVYLWRFAPGRRGARVGWLLAGAVLVSLPWLVRNAVLVGNPFFSLSGYRVYMFTDASPGHTLWRGFGSRSLLVPGRAGALLGKALVGLRDGVEQVLFLTGNIASVFIPASLFCRFGDGPRARYRWLFFSFFAVELAAWTLFRPGESGLRAFIPAGTALVSAAFLRLGAGFGSRGRTAALSVFVFLVLLPSWSGFVPAPYPRVAIYNPGLIEEISAAVPPDRVIVSDVPWAVAWYGDRSSLWLPARVGDYEEINLYYVPPVEAFYITAFYLGPYYDPGERDPGWQRLTASGWLPEGWNLRHRHPLPGGQVLLSASPLLGER